LSLDGSATIDVNGSVAALVALRGADFEVDPWARLDRDRLRAMFEGPGARVSGLSTWRRDTRRFVHVSVDVDDVRRASRLAPLAWSAYRFDRQGQGYEFRQRVGPSTGRAIDNVGWTGHELVRFRIHAPSRIPFHNAPSRRVERGNVLTWEQPMQERLKGVPLEMQVDLEGESILSTTLVLFASAAAAALAAVGLVIWWVARRGRDAELVESRS
jgi:hypothetical protein